MPRASKPLGTEVKDSIENLAHLVDTSVASKYGSDLEEMSCLISGAVDSKFDKIQGQLEESISRLVRTTVLQVNDEALGKKPMPNDSGKLLDHMSTPCASVSVTPNTQVPLDNNQGSLNYASGSANNFTPSAAPPTVATSVAQYHSSNNRSGALNLNLQQPYYQTSAYNPQSSYTQLGTNPQPSYTQFGTNHQPSHTQLGTHPQPGCIQLGTDTPPSYTQFGNASPSAPQVKSTPSSLRD